MFNKGDILQAHDRSNNAAVHYIVYLEGFDSNYFIGAMLTTKKVKNRNILMDASHFEVKSSSGVKWKIQFKNSHIVRAKLHKLNSWAPFNKVGQLTTKGVQFVESNINHLQCETWQEYENRMKLEGK